MKLAALVAVVLLIRPFMAAGSPGLIGRWEAVVDGQAYVMVLEADGTGTLMDQPMRYEAVENVFQVLVDGNALAYLFTLDGDRLTLSDGGTTTIRFVRRSSSSTGVPPASGDSAALDSSLVGRWKDPNGAVIELRADGTGSNAQGTFHYQAADGYLYLAESRLLLRYEVAGTNLKVTGQDGSLTFMRAGADDKVGGGGGSTADIVVNGVKLTATQVRNFEQKFQIRMLGGNYWYDSRCGAWGTEGGPTLGFLPAALELGGPLKANASGGAPTNVFINGRQIHPADLAALQQITPVIPGRYWVDAVGNCGYEGNPVPLANLVQLSQAAQSRKGGSYISRNDITGIGTGGDGKTSYVMGKDWSVIVGE